MGLFKKIFNEDIWFSKKRGNQYKLLLALESDKDNYIISYIDRNCKITESLNEKDLNSLKFIQKTNNIFYKRFRNIDVSTVLTEMTSGSTGAGGISTDSAGIGGTTPDQFSSDFYAPDDARNIVGTGKKKKKKGKNLNNNDPKFPVVKRPMIKDMINGKK